MKLIAILVVLLGTMACAGVDQSVLDEQKQLRQEVTSLNKQVAELKAQFDTLAKEVRQPSLDQQPRKIDVPEVIKDEAKTKAAAESKDAPVADEKAEKSQKAK